MGVVYCPAGKPLTIVRLFARDRKPEFTPQLCPARAAVRADLVRCAGGGFGRGAMAAHGRPATQSLGIACQSSLILGRLHEMAGPVAALGVERSAVVAGFVLSRFPESFSLCVSKNLFNAAVCADSYFVKWFL